MAGKRPDQHNIDPSEGRSTDHKTMPQVGKGVSSEDDTARLDRERLAREQQRAEGQPFPPDVPAPSVHAREGARRDASDAEGRTETGKENPLA